MLNIEDKIENLKKYFIKEPDILGVWIVGSYGTEYQREDSDIDFAILFDKDIDDMEEMKFACDITDILKVENIDTINLKKAPITLQFKTIKEGRNLYEADYIKVCDYIEYVINEYSGFKSIIYPVHRNHHSSF